MAAELQKLSLQFPRPDLDPTKWEALYAQFWDGLKHVTLERLQLLCRCYSHNPKATRFPTVGQLLDAASAAGLDEGHAPKRDSESVYGRFARPASRPIGSDIGPNPDAEYPPAGQGASLPVAAGEKPRPPPMPEPTQSAEELKKIRLETLQKRLEHAGETWG